MHGLAKIPEMKTNIVSACLLKHLPSLMSTNPVCNNKRQHPEISDQRDKI